MGARERHGSLAVALVCCVYLPGRICGCVGDWTRHEVTFTTDFDLAQTDLVALSVMATAPADEIVFRNFSFSLKR